jgi:membrane-bound lytic murein transglycosylase B
VAIWLGVRIVGERDRVRQAQTPAPAPQAVAPVASGGRQQQASHDTQPEPPPSVATPPAPAPRRAAPGVRTIRSDLVFRPEPAGPFASVVAALSPPADGVGAPVSADEFRRLLDDPRAEVYWPELLKYASPQSRKIQKQEHESFIPIFMKPAKIAAGAAFLSDHATELAAAQARYGVPPKDIVSVLMWESNLGKSTGKYRVANIYLGQLLYLDEAAAEAERTSAVRLDAADRSRHVKRLERIKRNAEKYLVALLRSCKAKGVDPFSILGSWGGAIGFPQFMPTSFQYAVDGNADGKIDLYSFPDAIASIGNYLSERGYRASRAKAIHAYNPEDEYVRGVQMYADAITRGRGGR